MIQSNCPKAHNLIIDCWSVVRNSPCVSQIWDSTFTVCLGNAWQWCEWVRIKEGESSSLIWHRRKVTLYIGEEKDGFLLMDLLKKRIILQRRELNGTWNVVIAISFASTTSRSSCRRFSVVIGPRENLSGKCGCSKPWDWGANGVVAWQSGN